MIVLRGLVLLLILMAAGSARAVVLGGGLPDKDCRLAFGGVDATDGTSQVTCADGDTCDADGAADGSCHFAVSLCVGVPVAGCIPDRMTSIDVFGLPLEAPPLPSTADTCGPSAEITVPLLSQEGVTAIARDGRALKDVDYLNLCCVPTPSALASARCAAGISLDIAGCPTGTLPRGVRTAFGRARGLLDQMADGPGAAEERRLARKAAKQLGKVRRLAKRLAQRQACGDTVGLMATHALERVRALLGQAPSR